jgi:hypothetical protein
MQQFALAEFQRWRDACAEQRQQIARGQFLTFDISELTPALDVEGLASVIGPNNKPLGQCTSAEFNEMAEWYTAILKASREVVGALELRSAARARI